MNNWLYYFLQVIIASGILYGYYHLALRNKKFHQYNRFYLLAAVVISISVPFLDIPVYFSQQDVQSSFVVQTLTIISSPAKEEPVTALIAKQNAGSSFDLVYYLFYAFGLFAVLVLGRIVLSLVRIRKLSRSNTVEKIGKINFVNTDEPGTPFSFFRWLFWNRNIELRSEKGEQIFRHELFHIQQKHSLDILFIELLTAVFWINPFFYLIKKEIKAIHEFLADRFAMNENNRWEYAELLLMQVLNTKQQLVNPFFHNQIKRRIAMITTSKKPGYVYLRKLMVLPVAAIVIILFAFSYKKKDINNNMFGSGNSITVVIDAAHGGTDAGVISPDQKYSEAQISLEIAKQIQKLGKEYNVNVVMTREDESFPGNAVNKNEGLKKRIEIANETKPDAFIAIHINGEGNTASRSLTKGSGFEAYVSDKKENVNGRMLASAILKSLSPVYTTSLELKQRKEAGVYVLDHNNYPAVLLECGYINNSEDLAFITNKSNQEKVARSILEAIVGYKNSEGKMNQITAPGNADTVKPGSNSTFNGSLKIAKLDSSNSKDPSKMIINGKEITIKEVRVEGLEDSKIEAVELHMTDGLFTIDTSDRPLIVIDGIKQPLGSSLQNIDPASIESVNVFKGPTAVAKYGSKGKNGAIEIFTKTRNDNEVREVRLQEIKPDDADNKIFEKVEIEPTFPGGEVAWRNLVTKNINSLIPVKNGATPGTYTVYIQFVVHKDGSVSDIKPLTNHGFGMEAEAIRVIRKGSKWIPGIQNGRTVNAYKKQPINFVVEKNNKVTRVEKSLPEIVSVGYLSLKSNRHVTTPGSDIPVLASTDGGSGEWKKFFERNLDANYSHG
jgi:N-acetylmuramoyl-L-alanine amidase